MIADICIALVARSVVHPPRLDVRVSRNHTRQPLELEGVAACIAWAESRDEPTVINPASGAAGLFQYLPSTWASLGYAQRFGVPTASEATFRQQVWAFNDTVRRFGLTPWTGDPCVGAA